MKSRGMLRRRVNRQLTRRWKTEQRIATLRDALQEQTQRLESVLTVAGETSQRLEQHSVGLEHVQQQALSGFHAQIENQLNPHREEIQRRSEALFEEINSKIAPHSKRPAARRFAQFDRQVQEIVVPHVNARRRGHAPSGRWTIAPGCGADDAAGSHPQLRG